MKISKTFTLLALFCVFSAVSLGEQPFYPEIGLNGKLTQTDSKPPIMLKMDNYQKNGMDDGAGINEFLYGVYGFGSDILVIDVNAATGTARSSRLFHSLYNWAGATNSASNYYFWATTTTGYGRESALYKVAPYTNAVIQVGTDYGPRPDNPSFKIDMRELAFDEDTNTLYGTDYSRLYTIDTNTGLANYIGDFGIGIDGNAIQRTWSMDYDESIHKLVIVEQLYADPLGITLGDAIMYYVNPATGAATYVGNTNVQALTDLCYSALNNKTYATGNRQYRFFDVDTANGQVFLKSMIAHNILGLAAGPAKTEGVGVSITNCYIDAEALVESQLGNQTEQGYGHMGGSMDVGTSASAFVQESSSPQGVGQSTEGSTSISAGTVANHGRLTGNIGFNTNYNGSNTPGYGKGTIRSELWGGSIEIGTDGNYPPDSEGLMLLVDGRKILSKSVDNGLLDWQLKIFYDDPQKPLVNVDWQDLPEARDAAGTVDFLASTMVRAGQILNFEFHVQAELNKLSPDINNDGIVDYDDLKTIADNWLSYCDYSNGWCSGADLDTSYNVNLADYARFANCWLTGSGQALNETFDVNLAFEFSTVKVPTFTGVLNDDCNNAIVLNLGETHYGSTVGATGVDMTSCGYNNDYDVWYKFTPDLPGIYKIDLRDVSNNFYPYLALFDQCGGTELLCLGYWQYPFYFDAQANTTYLVRIAGYWQRTGTFNINVTYCPPPDNDLCENATQVYEGQTINGTTIAATQSTSSSCGRNDYKDVWYAYTPSQTGFVTFELSGTGAVLSLYDRCGGTELACQIQYDDDMAFLTYQLEEGTTYYIRAAFNENGMYDFTFSVVEPPYNDLCENAQPVSMGTIDGSTYGATGSNTSSCGSNDTADIWYSFTPDESSTYDLVLNNDSGNCYNPMTFSLYDYCDGSELACATADCYNSAELISYLESGQTYFIRVARNNNGMGYFDFNITTILPPANDDCYNAEPIAVEGYVYSTTKGASGSDISSCGDQDSYDVWYHLTAESTETLYFFVQDDDTGGCEFTVSVYDACEGIELACDSCACQWWGSEASLEVQEGNSYFIRIARNDNSMGDFYLMVSNYSTCEGPS